MKLDYLIKDVETIKIDGTMEVEISQVVDDSRKVTPNSIFVAIEGFTVDGHKYIGEAIDNGASAVVISKEISELKEMINGNEVTIIKVENTRIALAKISSIFYNEPSKHLELIGITGTNGKTSTTYFIESIFKEANKKVGIVGSIGNVINGELNKTKNTTPESLEVQQILNKMVEADIDICAMEVSSHALELYRTKYCQFNVGIFTNLTTDHLDYHKTIDNYLKAKLKLFYQTNKYNIINIDDKYGKKVIDETKKIETLQLTYGIGSEADIYASDIKYAAEGVSYTLNTPKGSININTKIPGLFTVYNTLAAASCSYIYGIGLNTIKNGLEAISGVKGRFEVVPIEKDFTVIIDFAHTPDSLEKALQTVKQFAKGRVVTLFGAGGDRDNSKRPIMGEIAARNSDFCIVTSDNPRTEDPESIVEDVLEGVKKCDCEYVSIIDRKEAIRYALENSEPEDVILLAGKGHETYTLIGGEVFPFDEKKIVLDILSKMQD